MNKKTFVPLILAIVLGLVAAVAAQFLVKRARSRSAGAYPTMASIVTVKADIQPGHELTADDLVIAKIPASKAPANCFVDPASVQGRVAIGAMSAGQPVMEMFLARQGTAAGLQALVPPGMRAITLDVTESSGLGGLLVAGAHVDVISTAPNAQDTDLNFSRLVVQDAPVLAVGQQLGVARKDGEPAPISRTVTLLVNPHDAAALDLAQGMTRVRLILRGSNDRKPTGETAVLFADLRGAVPASKPQPAAVAGTPAVMPVSVPATQPVATPHEEPAQRIVTFIFGDKQQRYAVPDVNADSQASSDPNYIAK